MAKPTKRLGRGLDSLVSNLVSQLTEETVQPTPITPRTPAQPPRKPNHRPAATETRGNDRTEPTQGSEYPTSAGEIPLTLLSPNPYQPRKSIDPQDLQELADSLRVNGMINPITVRRSGSGFQIIAGERRWQAAKLAGLQTVPVSIKSADDRQMHELALVENIQRQDLNAIDRAKAYQEYCRKYRASADDIAKRLGENRTTVTNYLRLLDLPDEVQSLVAGGQLTMGHARCLVGVEENERRIQLAKTTIANALSVRALEELIREARNPYIKAARVAETTKPTAHKPKSAHIQDLEVRFATALSTRVQIVEGRNKDSGRIVIEYYTLTDFDRLAQAMGINLDE